MRSTVTCLSTPTAFRIAVTRVDPQPYMTRFHQLAHVLLGHTGESEQRSGELTPHGLRECEVGSGRRLCCAAPRGICQARGLPAPARIESPQCPPRIRPWRRGRVKV